MSNQPEVSRRAKSVDAFLLVAEVVHDEGRPAKVLLVAKTVSTWTVAMTRT